MTIDQVDSRPPRSHYLGFRSGSSLTPPLLVREASPISANELLGTTLDDKKLNRMPSFIGREMDGFSLSDKPIKFFEVTGQDPSVKEFIGVVQDSLGGRRFNQLLLSISPYKDYGLDTDDCITDWSRVDDPDFKETIGRHVKALGLSWKVLERNRQTFIWLLREGSGMNSNEFKQNSDPSPEITPVMRWSNWEGKRIWELNYLRGFPYEGIRHDTSINPSYYLTNPLAGLYAAALFSPEVTSYWPRRDRYTPGGHLREIGTTQVVVYAVEKSYQFLNGNFVQAAEQYVKANAA